VSAREEVRVEPKLIVRMIYSSITPYVHMLRTAEDDEEHVCLDFSDPNPRRGDIHGYDSFGVSLRQTC
jgi:hypothetical protein